MRDNAGAKSKTLHERSRVVRSQWGHKCDEQCLVLVTQRKGAKGSTGNKEVSRTQRSRVGYSKWFGCRLDASRSRVGQKTLYHHEVAWVNGWSPRSRAGQRLIVTKSRESMSKGVSPRSRVGQQGTTTRLLYWLPTVSTIIPTPTLVFFAVNDDLKCSRPIRL